MTAATDFAMLARLPPAGAIAYLQGRGDLTVTHSWQDLWHEEHARQFTISRLTRLDLLDTIRQSLEKSVNGELTRRDWMRDTEKLLKDAGWWGAKEVIDPAAGETVTTTFDAARLKLIFDTNTRQAAAAGQWERVQATKRTHPYLRYITKDDDRVRPAHRAWHNLVLPVDDPFWKTHWPPNGWRCRCRVVAMSQREYDSGRAPGGARFNTKPPSGETIEHINRRTGEVTEVPAGVDPGFGYNAGEARRETIKVIEKAKLRAAAPAIARAALKEGTTLETAAAPAVASLKEIEAFLSGASTEPIPIALAPRDIQAQIGAINRSIYLSRQTVLKQLKHPEITAESYAWLQELLDNGERVYDRARHAIVIYLRGAPYIAVLKATADGMAIFLQSFRRSDAKNIEALRKRKSDS